MVPSVPAVLLGSGVLWAALALLDPFQPAGRFLGPLLALAAVIWESRRRRPPAAMIVGTVLAWAFGLAAWSGPEFRADSASYYYYLRSVAFDRDLDFGNEAVEMNGVELPRTSTGLRFNSHPVGPAFAWSPFFAAAHAYVRTFGHDRYAADGYTVPYRRSLALGTLTWAILGAWAMTRTIAAAHGMGTAVLCVAGAVLTSPLLYYLFVVPTMAHGLTFAAAATLLGAWDRARRLPSLGSWTAVGALLGLVTLMRWQAIACVLLFLPLAVEGVLRRTVRPLWLAAGAGAAALVFSPQLFVWNALFGRMVTMPQGTGFVDWWSPHWLDTLVSANHGLLAWTPAMALGLLGLVWGLRGALLLHGGALLVFAAAIWVNGGVWDWAAGDAYGARRYDFVVPLVALGFVSMVKALTALSARVPLATPSALLLLLTLWNTGFIAHFRQGRYPDAAPLDLLAQDQARGLRRQSERILGYLGGARGRALAYKYFSAEYVFGDATRDGSIALGAPDQRLLVSGWSSPHRRPNEPGFRWALFPEACVVLPLEESTDLTVDVTARAPRRAPHQVMGLVINGVAIGSEALASDWGEHHFEVPAGRFRPGENALCLRFSSAVDGGEGVPAAAAVALIRLH